HALRRRGVETADFASVERYLADTPSRLLVISMEDILGMRDQVNLPGTTSEHPNWRHRLPVLLEDLKNQAGLMSTAETVGPARRASLPGCRSAGLDLSGLAQASARAGGRPSRDVSAVLSRRPRRLCRSLDPGLPHRRSHPPALWRNSCSPSRSYAGHPA